MDNSFLKEQADRCRSLAEKADKFTKRRLLDLAAKYEERLGRPSRVTRTLGPPENRPEAPQAPLATARNLTLALCVVPVPLRAPCSAFKNLAHATREADIPAVGLPQGRV